MLLKFHTVLKVLCRDITVAPLEKHHRIYEECQYKVEEHTAHHNEQTLPGGFGAELTWLAFLLDPHPYLSFNLFYSYQRDAGIEKEIKLLNPRFEQT